MLLEAVDLSRCLKWVMRAIAHDPLTASVLSLAEIKEMVNELFAT